jgi:hypothetical protein
MVSMSRDRLAELAAASLLAYAALALAGVAGGSVGQGLGARALAAYGLARWPLAAMCGHASFSLFGGAPLPYARYARGLAAVAGVGVLLSHFGLDAGAWALALHDAIHERLGLLGLAGMALGASAPALARIWREAGMPRGMRQPAAMRPAPGPEPPVIELLPWKAPRPLPRASAAFLDGAQAGPGATALQRALDGLGVPARVVSAQDDGASTAYALRILEGGRMAALQRARPDIALALGVDPALITIGQAGGLATIETAKARPAGKMADIGNAFRSRALDRAPLMLPIGEDAAGSPIVADLAALPHLLAAGCPGSGKSVFLQAVIISLALRLSPSRLGLLLIDASGDGLSPFASLPHCVASPGLLSEPAGIVAGLGAACAELGRRGQMARAGGMAPLPALVVVVDELDMLLGDRAIRRDVEPALARLAKEGRKYGIHLVLGSQRPSGDLLSPHILACMPARVCMRTASETQSRIIIGSGAGASLAGKGDLLFLDSGGLRRAQGYHVAERQIGRLAQIAAQRHAHAPGWELPMAGEGAEGIYIRGSGTAETAAAPATIKKPYPAGDRAMHETREPALEETPSETPNEETHETLDIAEIKRLHASGIGYRAIAAQLGTSPATICRRLKG